MARRHFNTPFLMTPFNLLRIPEYSRFFDGAAIGSLHRLLMTGIRRQGVQDLKDNKGMFISETGWITHLARLYDDGHLASYFTLKDLEEATGYTERHVRNLIEKLQEVRLVKVEEFNDGYVFTLGKRLIYKEADGYNVGEEHEGFFIDAWESWAEKNRDEFIVFLAEKLASPKQREKVLGKIFHDGVKNFSQKVPTFISEKDRPGQDSLDAEESPIIDKTRIESILKMDSNDESVEEMAKKEAYARIRSEPNWLEKVKAGREAMVAGASLQKVNQKLAKELPSGYKEYSEYPRVGFTLWSEANSEKRKRTQSHIKLGDLWAALAEDVTGVNHKDTSQHYKEIVGFYKTHLAQEYSYDQIMWSFLKALKNSYQAQFLAKGGRNLAKIVTDSSKEYQEILAERQRMVSEEERADQLTKEREEKLKALEAAKGSAAGAWFNYGEDDRE